MSYRLKEAMISFVTPHTLRPYFCEEPKERIKTARKMPRKRYISVLLFTGFQNLDALLAHTSNAVQMSARTSRKSERGSDPGVFQYRLGCYSDHRRIL